MARFPRRQHHYFIALTDNAGRNGAAETAKIEMRSIHELNRKAEVLEIPIRTDVNTFQKSHQGGAVVPGHRVTGIDDVVPIECRNRDEVQIGNVESS